MWFSRDMELMFMLFVVGFCCLFVCCCLNRLSIVFHLAARDLLYNFPTDRTEQTTAFEMPIVGKYKTYVLDKVGKNYSVCVCNGYPV